jgi:hypothetical protein
MRTRLLLLLLTCGLYLPATAGDADTVRHTIAMPGFGTLSIVLPSWYDTVFSSRQRAPLEACYQTQHCLQPRQFSTATGLLDPPELFRLTISHLTDVHCDDSIREPLSRLVRRRKETVTFFDSAARWQVDEMMTINGRLFGLLGWDNHYLYGPVYRRLCAFTLVKGRLVLFNFANSTAFHREHFWEESLAQLKTVTIEE